jgi:hypothetical protein
MAQSHNTISSTGPTVLISGDRMTATVRIPRDCPTALVNSAGLMQLVRDAGLPTGPDTAAMIEQAVRQYTESPHELRVTVGQGVAPQRGTNGRLVWADGIEPDASPVPAEPTDEPVDYYECSPYTCVREGQHLATLIAPTPGQPGFDVYGQRIAPMPGKPYPLSPDPSVRITATGRVIAERSGLLSFTRHTIHVSAVLQIAQCVDFSTGNVRFDGSVIIGSNVRDRFKIEVTEDVFANGLIEAAHIRCGGSLRAEGGMAGREAGTIDIARNVFARYLVGVSGDVGGSLTVQKEIINCSLNIGGALHMPGGSLIAGRLRIAGKAQIAQIGSDAAVATALQLGYVPQLAESLNQLAADLPTLDQRIKALRDRLDALLCKSSDDADVQRARTQVAQVLRQLEDRQRQMLEQQATLADQFNATCRVELTIYRAVHAGVSLDLPRARLEFHTKMPGPVTFRRHRDGRIAVDNASGEPVNIAQIARVLRTATW